MTLQMHYQEKYEEGLEKGLEQGMEQGAEREKVEIAKRMLVDGDLPVDKITRFSGLDLDRVLELKRRHNKLFHVLFVP